MSEQPDHPAPSPGDARIPNPFHAGELRAQGLAGIDTAAARSVGIRDRMPPQHREFFPLLPFLCVAVLDDGGWPLAALAQGRPGFVTSPDDTRLDVAAMLAADDPARAHLLAGARRRAPVGLLGIDLATRRRNRANGVIAAAGPDGFTVQVLESFGNCPRYIAVHRLRPVAREPGPALAFAGDLPERARALIAASGTLFVASSSGAGAMGGVEAGAARLDISHRGGPPGFVRVDGAVLTIPDYAGNRYYNTLGNFVLEPRAALVLADPDSGDILQLQGRVEVDWDLADGAAALRSAMPADAPAEPPAERSWRFRVERGVLRPGAFGLGVVE